MAIGLGAAKEVERGRCPSWQAKAGQGYAIDSFRIDWDAQTDTCPQGQTTSYWNPNYRK